MDSPRGKKKWPVIAWAYSNFGMLSGVERTRAGAIREIERNTGRPWSVTRHYFEVWKCAVAPLKKKRNAINTKSKY